MSGQEAIEARRTERLFRKLMAEPLARRGEHVVAYDAAFRATLLPEDAETTLRNGGYKVGKRRGVRTASIVNDFFEPHHFRGGKILEIGPGQYSFALIAGLLGAEVEALELNASKVDAGRQLGFTVYHHNMFRISDLDLADRYDGLWLKGTFNPLIPPTPEDRMLEFVRDLTGALKDDGWAWCCPNVYDRTPGDHTPTAAESEAAERQAEVFRSLGWRATEIEDADRVPYALKSLPYRGSKYIYTINLR